MSGNPHCLVCDTEHAPEARCDDVGMDRQIAKLGSRRWNTLSGAKMAPGMRRTLALLREDIARRHDPTPPGAEP